MRNDYIHIIHINMNSVNSMTGSLFDEMKCEEGKHIFGTVKVGERGQIVIPKEARDIFQISPGDTLMVLGDEKRGIALVKADKFRSLAMKMLRMFEEKQGSDPELEGDS